MLKHLALVENSWFEVVLHGRNYMAPFDKVDWDADPDWDWRTGAEDDPEHLRALFDEALGRADVAI